jgi:biotin synthase
MQSGEDYGIERDWFAGVIRRIKAETPLAVTLGLGERPTGDLAAWRAAGADRYLLRFETSDPALYALIHPPREGIPSDRIAMLRELRRLGYEIGSGVMVGIPGQTFRSLAQDVRLFAEMDIDMIGVGPYIPHPATPLGSGRLLPPDVGAEQVPNTAEMTCKVVALTRLVCPEANLPSTTALATVDKARGRVLGLMRGANVVMPNCTPLQYRVKYEIYPDKACLNETAQTCRGCLAAQLASIGRTIGKGPGGRKRHSRAMALPAADR